MVHPSGSPGCCLAPNKARDGYGCGRCARFGEPWPPALRPFRREATGEGSATGARTDAARATVPRPSPALGRTGGREDARGDLRANAEPSRAEGRRAPCLEPRTALARPPTRPHGTQPGVVRPRYRQCGSRAGPPYAPYGPPSLPHHRPCWGPSRPLHAPRLIPSVRLVGSCGSPFRPPRSSSCSPVVLLLLPCCPRVARPVAALWGPVVLLLGVYMGPISRHLSHEGLNPDLH